MKYARELMSKWHNCVVEGVRLKCQLELDPKQSLRLTQFSSRNKGRDRRSEPSHSSVLYTRSVQSEQDTIQTDDVENMGSKGFDEREVGAKQRIMYQATKGFPTTTPKNQAEHASSSESIPNAVDSSCELKPSMMYV